MTSIHHEVIEKDEPLAADSTPKLVSNWYEHECQRKCERRVSEYKYVYDDFAALQARTATVPIIHVFSKDDKTGEWVTSSIKVQDKSMQKVLNEALKDYQGLDLDIKGYTFAPPFMPLCHRWENLKQFQENVNDPILSDAASKLLQFLTPIITPSLVLITNTRETGKIAFKDIWQIFAPHTLVSTRFYGVQTTYRVTKYEQGPDWVIEMEFVNWNGVRTGLDSRSITIEYYDGYRRVTWLPVFPISFLQDEANYRTSMIDRGKIFEQLRGYHLMQANGIKVSREGGKLVSRPIAGRVCIDAYAYYTSQKIVKPELKPLPRYENGKATENAGDDDTEGSDKANRHPDSDDDYKNDGSSKVSGDPGPAAIEVEVKITENGFKRVDILQPLTDEQRLIAHPWVRGFDLKSKQWYELCVDELKPVVWNDEAFDRLVLPGDEKQMALEFVKAKSLDWNDEFDDFIADKGRGLLILMFGPPGVGKTFTAEAIADKSRVALYTMSASELGTEPVAVEKGLMNALILCCMWNAMLLLDEADVFLGARSPDNIARNELVSIFLRALERYQGTMFLTTNRIASLDPAFHSRIDIFLPYYNLTNAARRVVWANFIQHAGQDKFDVTDESLDKLSQIPLNGREIKSVIKTVQLLSLRSGSTISTERICMLAEKRVQALTQANESN